jgi:CRISPR-associated endonuclease Csn1
MVIREDLTFGIDLGIASCGWAVIRQPREGEGEIVGMGVWMFDAPETAKERTPTNQIRRTARGMRRVIDRRRQRMNALRKLFHAHGLIEGEEKNTLWIKDGEGRLLDPWELRAKGLDRRLGGPELAVVLGHIGKHRGFKSNSKRDRGANAPKDSSAMLKEIEKTRERMRDWRTVGEMFAKDELYAGRKRNRDGDYTRSVLRDDQAREVAVLFDAQRQLGNPLATAELERAFADTAFFQRPLQDSEHLVGDCPFEPGEKRAARRSYSFELFRMLTRLAALRLQQGREERALTPEEMRAAVADFGARPATVTYRKLRERLGLDAGARFTGVSPDAEKQDFVSRTGPASPGTTALREVLGEAPWRSLLATPEKLDRIAAVITFREDLGSIREGLTAIGLKPLVLEALMAAVEAGAFSDFKGAGHISAKAARRMIPHLMKGLVYSEAAAAAGYDHSKRPQTELSAITNPVARKALGEALKQVKAMVQEWGLPGRIHVELARDVGKSKEERDEIRFGIEKRNKAKERLKEEFETVVGRPCGGAEDLLRFELWKEQNGRCLYSDCEIHPDMILSGDRTVEVDHILPWSRFGDDSFVNKTLCFASANQEKRGRTPFEWQGADDARWEAFRCRVERIKFMKGRKKRNYTLKCAAEVEEKFRSRNLNDTRYASRVLADQLKRMYPDEGCRRVFARPGALTDRLRRGWGIQDLKKDEEGARLSDDRHHALDALICAAMSESALQRLTRSFQECEAKGSHRDFEGLEPPWPSFREDARSSVREVFVARAERRRARGEAHAATVRQVAERDGREVVYETKKVDLNFKRDDLARIKDADRNREVVAAISEWIDAGRPSSALPLKMFGGHKEPVRYEPIRKVKVATNKKVDVLVREGAAERGEMVRVDVFRKQNKRGAWEFYLVPIYPHQIADKETWPRPPNKAISAFKEEDNGWIEMDPTFHFAWSLYPLSYIELEKADATFIDGYFRGVHRGTGNLSLSRHQSKDALIEGLGPRRLKSLGKFAVDRLGRRYPIERETRTWRGAACT